MKKYDVLITNQAKNDLEEIYEYIKNKLLSPTHAIKQYDRIVQSILSLECFPKKYALFQSEPEHTWGIRRMIIDNYLICYIVDNNRVVVTNVLYGASNIHRILVKNNK